MSLKELCLALKKGYEVDEKSMYDMTDLAEALTSRYDEILALITRPQPPLEVGTKVKALFEVIGEDDNNVERHLPVGTIGEITHVDYFLNEQRLSYEIQFPHGVTNTVDATDGYPIEVVEHWDEEPDYPVSDWQHEVANGDTRLGYWAWVQSKRES